MRRILHSPYLMRIETDKETYQFDDIVRREFHDGVLEVESVENGFLYIPVHRIMLVIAQDIKEQKEITNDESPSQELHV